MQDLLRLIEIEGVDINPCGGTHLSCTSELQVLKIVGLEKSRGQARLHFMVGGRVLAALGSALKREVALNKVDVLHLMAGLPGLISCLLWDLVQSNQGPEKIGALALRLLMTASLTWLLLITPRRPRLNRETSGPLYAQHWVVCHIIGLCATAWRITADCTRKSILAFLYLA